MGFSCFTGNLDGAYRTDIHGLDTKAFFFFSAGLFVDVVTPLFMIELEIVRCNFRTDGAANTSIVYKVLSGDFCFNFFHSARQNMCFVAIRREQLWFIKLLGDKIIL